jgi:hypothetical protein
LRFRIEHPGGRIEELVVDAERALLGSAAHCEVRLAPESAGPEHVEVLASQGHLYISPRINERTPLINGVPCAEGIWPPGSVLTVGTTKVTAGIVDLSDRRRQRSPFWLLLPVPVVALIAVIFLSPPAPRAEAFIPEAVPLFDPPISTCPVPPREEVRAFANERLRLALARRERGPFLRTEAVDAVPLFEVAAACFRTAGLTKEAAEADQAAKTLRRKLEEEYHLRRVRLEHAFRTADPFGSRRELLVLVPMTARRKGPYVEWLASVDRYAKLEVEQRSQTTLGK